ncbi:MAG: signal recognition particle receptor subunit alpha, partial [Candidatus Heimdallarchaeaceae archaeon]
MSSVIRRLVTGTTVDKKTVEEILKEIRKILLQADVPIELTDKLVENIRKKALKEKIPAGLTLREHVLKIIYEELVNLLGGKPEELIGK